MDARYSLADPLVDPPIWPLTEDEYRDKVSDGVGSIVQDLGPTKVGKRVGCNEKTVRKARDKQTYLEGHLCWNLLLADPHALDPLAAYFGKAFVDLHPRPVDWFQLAACASELSAAVHRASCKGHISHQDLPKLKNLVRKLLTMGQGACR